MYRIICKEKQPMFKCNNCSYTSQTPFSVCPQCASVPQYSEAQIRDYLYIIHKALKSRRYEVAVSGYRALADVGHTASQIEYAKILEAGELVPKDLDGAMSYFYSAATKNDPYAAYRYSRLLSRTSDAGASFWLEYSALLGCKQAYCDVAKACSLDGDEQSATYYYSLAAECEDRAAAIALVKRYYGGVGAEKNDAHARWYLDKLGLVPISLFRTAFKLRSVKAQRPTPPRTARVSDTVRTLSIKAKEFRYFYTYILQQ